MDSSTLSPTCEGHRAAVLIGVVRLALLRLSMCRLRALQVRAAGADALRRPSGCSAAEQLCDGLRPAAAAPLARS